ncbi:MAG TPA: hypothetical protein DCG69_00450 [Bacteroidales bacterium]|nr:hypothetical protein [Bacteroidales bacterium]
MKALYAVLLGGKIRENNLMEDHQLVFVVADNELDARKLAKLKWPEATSIHVDGTQILTSIDGYQISLTKELDIQDKTIIDNQFSK